MISEVTVVYFLNAARTHWVARGRTPMSASPWVEPPTSVVAVFDQSTFDSTKGFG